MSEAEQAAQADSLTFEIDPGDHAPSYVQIARQIRMAVADGTLRPGTQLPPVREAARRMGLSPNTVGRAYSELSREGVIAARAGGGSVIASADRLDRSALMRARQERLKTLARQVVVRGLSLNLGPAEILQAVKTELRSRGRTSDQPAGTSPLGSDEASILTDQNRLEGRVTSVRTGEHLCEVAVTLRDASSLRFAVPRADMERLGIEPGQSIAVIVKVTDPLLAS
jgi:GntR family transcriptional regulator